MLNADANENGSITVTQAAEPEEQEAWPHALATKYTIMRWKNPKFRIVSHLPPHFIIPSATTDCTEYSIAYACL